MYEFELIHNYFSNISKKNNAALNLNDDVFFDKIKGVVISVDTYNIGTHFFNFKSPDLGSRNPTSPRREASLLNLPGAFAPGFFFARGSWPERLNKRNSARAGEAGRKTYTKQGYSP